MRESTKVKNKSFTVYIELRNIRRSITKNTEGNYRYMFDAYIEGKLEHKDMAVRAHSIDYLKYIINHKAMKIKKFQ